jgi:hypothetical protein
MASQDVMRWQLDVPAGRARELDTFSDAYGFATRKDLINTALSFLQWAVAEVKTGRIIASVDEKTMRYKQIDLPAFKLAAAEASAPATIAAISTEMERLAQQVESIAASPVQQQKARAARVAVDELAMAFRG